MIISIFSSLKVIGQIEGIGVIFMFLLDKKKTRKTCEIYNLYLLLPHRKLTTKFNRKYL